MLTKILVFLFGCILSRLAFAYIAYKQYIPLKYLGYIALLIAVGLLFSKRKIGPETFGEPIWWANIRPIHSALYFLFAYLAITNCKQAWKVIVVDAMFGLIMFTLHQFKRYP